jgi:hypothetical protein
MCPNSLSDDHRLLASRSMARDRFLSRAEWAAKFNLYPTVVIITIISLRVDSLSYAYRFLGSQIRTNDNGSLCATKRTIQGKFVKCQYFVVLLTIFTAVGGWLLRFVCRVDSLDWTSVFHCRDRHRKSSPATGRCDKSLALKKGSW